MSVEQKTEPAVDCINKSSWQIGLQNVVLHTIQGTIIRFRTSFVYGEITVIMCTQNYLYTVVARYCHFRWREWEKTRASEMGGKRASPQRHIDSGIIMSAYKWGVTVKPSREDILQILNTPTLAIVPRASPTGVTITGTSCIILRKDEISFA